MMPFTIPFTKIAIITLRILIFILIFLTILPVALLPLSTSIPPSIQILFAMIEVALLVAVFRLGFSWRMMLAELAGFVAIALIAIFASQVFASTPPILDPNGKPMPQSIAVMETVKLGGSEEWITIRGKDSRNPLLLFLAGSPGGSQLVLEQRALAELEDRFVVVNWDQPGAGKSFHAIDHAKLTPDRYISDAHELVLHLCQRFGKDKIYLSGQVENRPQQGSPPYYGNDVLPKMMTYLNDLNKYGNEDRNLAIAKPKSNS